MIFAKFRSNEDGTSIVELAIIAPVVIMILLGTIDNGHSLLVRATLDGAVQDAAAIACELGERATHARPSA